MFVCRRMGNHQMQKQNYVNLIILFGVLLFILVLLMDRNLMMQKVSNKLIKVFC